MARLVAYGHAGIDPKIMGLGPVSAVKRALAKAGLQIATRRDRVERGVRGAGHGRDQGARPRSAKVNPNGGAVALGTRSARPAAS
jgi:acetyl-CoA C-acetyltransferase